MPKYKNIQEVVRAIFYEVTAWYEDEEEYQPTQEEAESKVATAIASCLEAVIPEEMEEPDSYRLHCLRAMGYNEAIKEIKERVKEFIKS